MSVVKLGVECDGCTKAAHSALFDDAASKSNPNGYRAAFVSEIRLLRKDLPYLQDLNLIFDCQRFDGELKEIKCLLVRDTLEDCIFDLQKTWSRLEAKLTKRLNHHPGYHAASG